MAAIALTVWVGGLDSQITLNKPPPQIDLKIHSKLSWTKEVMEIGSEISDQLSRYLNLDFNLT